MRFLAILMLLALSFNTAAHARCFVESCITDNSHMDGGDPLCEGEQICVGNEGRQVSAPSVLAEPVRHESVERPAAICLSSSTRYEERIHGRPPLLTLLQIFLI